MSELRLERVDPFDGPGFDRYHAVYEAVVLADRGPTADAWGREESRTKLQHAGGVVERRAWSAVVGDETVGAMWLELPLKDSTHRAELAVQVLPAHRRRGYGSRMLAHLESQAGVAGRTTLGAEVWWPWELGAEGVGSPGLGFAHAHGFEVALTDVRRVLSLPVAPARLHELGAAAARHHGGYELRSFVGPVPTELEVGWASLDVLVETEAPTGGLDIETPEPDVAAVRESERLLAEQGRTSFGTVALAPDGTGVGMTHIVVSSEDGKAYQWGTLVLREHRGHRLGTALKVANLQMLQRRMPGVPSVSTYNAEVNAHMINVNEALGFRAVEWLGELQRRR